MATSGSVQVGGTLLVLGAGSLILPLFHIQFKILKPLQPWQPWVGLICAGIGLAIIAAHYLGQQSENTDVTYSEKNNNMAIQAAARDKAALDQQVQRELAVLKATVGAPIPGPVSYTNTGFNAVPVLAPAPAPALTQQQYNEKLNQAVLVAQTGNKTAAYNQLSGLRSVNPNDPNLLLWLAFTSPSRNEAADLVARVGQIDPTNPTLAGAQSWLASTNY